MSFFASAAAALSGTGNDWAATATKLEQALAKVEEAQAAGLAQDVIEGFYLRIEKWAVDASKIMRNMRFYNKDGPNPKDMAIEGIGKRVEELISEVDIRISARRYLKAAETARARRLNLIAPPVVRADTEASVGSNGTAGTSPNGTNASAATRSSVAPSLPTPSAAGESVGEREDRPPEYGA